MLNGEQRTESVHTELRWRRKVPLINNLVLWRDLAVVLVGSMIIFFLIIAVATGGEDLWALLQVAGLVLCIMLALLAIAVLVLWALTLGGPVAEFSINSKGIGYEAGKRSKTINSGIVAAGILAGSLNTAGAGMIAKSQEALFISWNEVRSVKIHRRQRVLYVRPKMLVGPIALYCTPDNFSQAETMVREYVPANKIKG
ncbi:hypothetical protein [Methanocella sp. MCL-LM]|uniref:hypothetical protein n=1 Tax=Methanocella sp. MCL-LM TaxID=3412035 RepID=UPI003C74A34B